MVLHRVASPATLTVDQHHVLRKVRFELPQQKFFNCFGASSRVSSGDKEADAAESFKKLEESVAGLQGFAQQPTSSVLGINLLSQHLLPTQKLLEECSQKVCALKASKSAGSLKQKNRVHERFAHPTKLGQHYVARRRLAAPSPSSTAPSAFSVSLTSSIAFVAA